MYVGPLLNEGPLFVVPNLSCHFQAKKLELKECLVNEMQEKKKAYETFRLTGDLASGGGTFWMGLEEEEEWEEEEEGEEEEEEEEEEEGRRRRGRRRRRRRRGLVP